MNRAFIGFGQTNHTLVPCWMSKRLLPRNQCTGCFAPSAFMGGGGGRENFELFHFMAISVIHIFCKVGTFPLYVSGLKMSYSRKFVFFEANLDEVPSPSKLKGPHEVILGDSPLSWSKQYVH